MKAHQKAKRTPKKGTKPSPETIEERVHRHLSDINSKITDDDIRSVKTELEVRKNSADKLQKENKANKRQKRSSGPKNDNKEAGDKKHTTPWDLLSEGYE